MTPAGAEAPIRSLHHSQPMPADLVTDDVPLVEDTWYDHETYGRVRILLLDDEGVVYENPDRRTGGVPLTRRESERAFRRNATPATQTVSLPVSSVELESNLM